MLQYISPNHIIDDIGTFSCCVQGWEGPVSHDNIGFV